MAGKVYNQLTVMSRAGKNTHGSYEWRCRCACGNERIVDGYRVRRGIVKSCSPCAYRAANLKHGLVGTPIYKKWASMMARCYKQNGNHYKYYGGRGISVCDKWHDPGVFVRWAKEARFRRGLTLERVDVNGNYEPSNCTWIPLARQSRNRRNNQYATIGGERKLIIDWTKGKGVSYDVLKYRIDHNWPEDKLFVAPHAYIHNDGG